LRLAVLRVAGARHAKRPKVAQPRNVLLIRPDHLGDVLFLTPGLRAIREAMPGARITLMVGPWSADVVRDNPDADAILTCPFPGFERQPKTSAVAPYRLLADTARRLRQAAFDTAVALRFDHWWGAWLAAEAGIPVRIGYDTPETRPFLTNAVAYSPDRHEVLQNARLLQTLAPDVPADPGPTRYAVSESDREWADAWLGARSVSMAQPLVAIHPGAGAAVKQWPSERWAAIAGRLITECGAQVLLTGVAAERALVDEVKRSLGRPVLDAAGRTSLGQLAALLARCSLVLGSDSGPLHLAVAIGAPTVHLYGPVDAAKFGPWGEAGRHLVVQTGWPCAPCNRLDWGAGDLAAHGCIPAIGEDQVWRAASARLSG
jgi:heptosyltransferase-2/heptosyltransferase-3